MKRLFAAVVFMASTLPAGAGVGPRSKCDSEQSRLCDGLVAIYQFEEGLSSGSTPTYPDAVRRNSYGLGDLYEPDAVDVGAGSTQSGVNNGFLGQNAYTFAQPTDFSGLKLWLKADAITGLNEGDLVTTWSDSSGQGNNYTQSGGSTLKPTYRVGVVNGKPVVRFDGSNDELTATSGSTLVSTASTTFAVFKRTSGSGKGTIVRTDNASQSAYELTMTNASTTQTAHGGSVNKASSSGVFQIASASYNGTTIKLGVNDTRDASMSSASAGGGAAAAQGIGASEGSYPFAGDIAELLVYNTTLSQTDRQKVESYLANKYNLTIPYEPVGGTTTDDPDAVEFDGASQYLHLGMDVRGVGILGNPAPWTVAFWVYPDTSGVTGQDQVIWSENGVQNGAPRLGTEIEFTNDGTKFFPRVRVYDALTEAATTASWGSNVSTSAWHLVVVTFRPRSLFTNGELSISVDGGTKVTAAISGNGGILTGVGPIIARRANPADPDFFDGRLDQLTIAGIEWTAPDIAAFYNGGAGREYPFVGN